MATFGPNSLVHVSPAGLRSGHGVRSPQPNLRKRPHTSRTATHRRRDADLPVGGVDFRTGEPVTPREYIPKKIHPPLSARILRPVTSRPRVFFEGRDLYATGDPRDKTTEPELTAEEEDEKLEALALAEKLSRQGLDFTLKQTKAKHKMPVEGWRAVAAVHTARHEKLRLSHKESMEELAIDLGVVGGLESYKISFDHFAKPFILAMVSAAEKQTDEAEHGAGSEQFRRTGSSSHVQGAVACLQKLAAQHSLDLKLVTSTAGFRHELLNHWRHIHLFVFDTSVEEFDMWKEAVDVVLNHRRERIRKCSAIVVLGSEDSMSDKERCIYDTQHREHKWQKIVKPVFFKQFSTIFERALAPEETSDERETMHATAQSKPSFWPPNTGAKRPPIFFSLLKEPHLLPAYDQPFGPPVTNAQRNTHDVVYERILAAVTRDDRPTSSRKHTKLLETSILTEKLGQKRPAHLRVVGKTSGLPLPHDTDSTFVEEQSLLESSISRTTRSKVTMQEETLKCIKAHPFVEKNLAGCENFSDVQKQYRLKGNKDELVPDTDGSLAYLAACRDLNVPPLQAFLRQIHDEFLFVRHNYVGSKGGKALGISLSLNSYPVDVDLGFCEIGSEGACALAKGINRAAIYRSMDLSGNRIGSVGMNAIAGSLIERAHYSQLKRLMLGSNQLCDSGALIVAKILHSVLNLDYLDLSCNKICTEGAAALGKALEQHGNPDAEVSSPQRTDSAQNGTTAQVQLRGLLHLDLSGNDLADSGTRALFNGMYKNGRLQTLILAHNYIGNEGAKAVSDFMIYNNTLTHLDVSHNKITGIAGEFIAGRAIKLDQKMSFLDISHNPLSAKAIVQIVEATRKQEPKRIRLLNLWNTLDDVNTGPRRCADKMFDNADELSAHIKEIESSVHEIKTTSGMYDEQLHQANLQMSRGKANPILANSSELSNLQMDSSTMSVTLAFAKTASLQYEALLDEAKAVLQDWRHQESAIEYMPKANEIMGVLQALHLVAGRYELSLGDPWHYFAFIHVLQAKPETLGLVLQVEYRGKGWAVPYMPTHGMEQALCDNFSLPFFYKSTLSHQSPRLDLDEVPKAGLAILSIKHHADVTTHHYKLDLSKNQDAALLQTLRFREVWFRNCERCADVSYNGHAISCFDHTKWTASDSGVIKLAYRMLMLDYHPDDVFGVLTLDLSLPWERVIALSLYEKLRGRALMRNSLIHASTSDMSNQEEYEHAPSWIKSPSFAAPSAHASRVAPRPIDQLPDWEGVVLLDDYTVPFETMLSVPYEGKMSFDIQHHRAEPRYSQAVILQMNIAVHQWIAEQFWVRCFDPSDTSRLKGAGNRGRKSCYDLNEFILEFPSFKNLEYQGMHQLAAKIRRELGNGSAGSGGRAGAGGTQMRKSGDQISQEQRELEEMRWRAPSGDSDGNSTFSFVYVLADARYLEVCSQSWDLSNEEERIEADNLFTGDDFLCANQVQIMPANVKRHQHKQAQQPLPVPSNLQHRALWRLPNSGILTAQRAKLLRVPSTRISSQALSTLIAELEEARKIPRKGYAVSKLTELLETNPQYKAMVPEQAIRVLEQIFADNDAVFLQAAAALYGVSREPQRFLLLLADHTSPSLARSKDEVPAPASTSKSHLNMTSTKMPL